MEDGNLINVKVKGVIKDFIEFLEKVEKDLNEFNLSVFGVECGSSSREYQEFSERRLREMCLGFFYFYYRGIVICMFMDYI